MSSAILSSLATTGPLAEIFSDASVVQAMLDFEVALARAQARTGVIPTSTADIIARAARADQFDAVEIARQSRDVATPAIPLVRMLTERVRQTDAVSAGYVHWGATSQDVCDTAMVLLLRRARPLIAEAEQRLARALRQLAESHGTTTMLARTLLQPAPPVTFGLKAAAWRAMVHQSWRRFDARFDEALLLQFGGASGTLAALAERGEEVARALSEELGLPCPAAPWHTRRDRLAAIVCAGAIYVGTLGKTARDIALLMQSEVGEVRERGGGSSAMPGKRNPSGCTVTLAMAARLPGLAASFLTAMVQEHERAAGGWQAEWPILADAVQSIGSAVASLADVAEGLEVDNARMRANIAAAGDAPFAERAAMRLAGTHGRQGALELVAKALAEGHPLSELCGLGDLLTPEAYLGSAERFRRALIED